MRRYLRISIRQDHDAGLVVIATFLDELIGSEMTVSREPQNLETLAASLLARLAAHQPPILLTMDPDI